MEKSAGSLYLRALNIDGWCGRAGADGLTLWLLPGAQRAPGVEESFEVRKVTPFARWHTLERDPVVGCASVPLCTMIPNML